MSLLPAWSEAFAGPGPGAAPTLDGVAIGREWAYGDGRGEGVRVAVVDSGIDAAHPGVGAVGRAVAVEPDPEGDAPDTRVVDEATPTDLYGHGTACAAIIRGLAPGVDLWSVRVLGPRLTGKGWVFAAAVEWCIEQGVQIVNLSLSTSSDAYRDRFHELVDRAVHAGIVVVSAMANDRKPTYPSQFAGVLSVAATEGRDREVLVRNPSPPAEWGAPGVDVEVAWLGGANVTVTGNSFAAPVVTAHAARIIGAHPGLSPWQVKTVLAALAVNASA